MILAVIIFSPSKKKDQNSFIFMTVELEHPCTNTLFSERVRISDFENFDFFSSLFYFLQNCSTEKFHDEENAEMIWKIIFSPRDSLPNPPRNVTAAN